MRNAWESWLMFVHDMATGRRMNEPITAALVLGIVATTLVSLVILKVPILGK